MARIADATFAGKKGKYGFTIYPSTTTFKAVAAVYIFTKRTVDSSGRGTQPNAVHWRDRVPRRSHP